MDHIIVLGEAHLLRILKSYARYYNEMRTHLALDKDAPVSRPVRRTGVVRSRAIVASIQSPDGATCSEDVAASFGCDRSNIVPAMMCNIRKQMRITASDLFSVSRLFLAGDVLCARKLRSDDGLSLTDIVAPPNI
jgi:hypothetical protein